MNIPELKNITIDKIELPVHSKNKIQVSVLRLDKINPVISGNKYFKLKYYLKTAIEDKHRGILTFGGAWSNHIVATAYAASLHNINNIGIIRGERSEKISETLKQSQEFGMHLEFISREVFKTLRNDPTLIAKQFSDHLIIPEGGSGEAGVRGAEEIMQFMNKNEFTHIACAIGTGTTFCGLVNASMANQKIIGIPVLKGMNDLEEELVDFLAGLEKRSACHFFYDYHFGGYAKYTSELISFMNEFYRQTNIPSDFVYTGKLFFAVNDLIEKNFFQQTNRLLVIHSGGLQGNQSLSKGTLIF